MGKPRPGINVVADLHWAILARIANLTEFCVRITCIDLLPPFRNPRVHTLNKHGRVFDSKRRPRIKRSRVYLSDLVRKRKNIDCADWQAKPFRFVFIWRQKEILASSCSIRRQAVRSKQSVGDDGPTVYRSQRVDEGTDKDCVEPHAKPSISVSASR